MTAFYAIFLLGSVLTGQPLGEMKIDAPYTKDSCEQIIADEQVRERIAEYANETLGPGRTKVIAGKCVEVEDQ